jgi:hypothetical protein
MLSLLLPLLLLNSAFAADAALPPKDDPRLGCRAIDGPAKVRSEPGGKVVHTASAGTTLKVIEINGEWAHVVGSANGCEPDKYEDVDSETGRVTEKERGKIEGWIQVRSIRKLPFDKLFVLDRCGVTKNYSSLPPDAELPDGRYFRASVGNKPCACAYDESQGHAAGGTECSERTPKAGTQFGVCKVFGAPVADAKTASEDLRQHAVDTDADEFLQEAAPELVDCFQRSPGTRSVFHCPASCLKLTRLPKLTPELRMKILREKLKTARASVQARLGSAATATLKSNFPNWVPLLHAFAPFQQHYEFEPELRPWLYRGNAWVNGRSRKIAVALIFEDEQSALDITPSWIMTDGAGRLLGKGHFDLRIRPFGGEAPFEPCVVPETPGPQKATLLSWVDPQSDSPSTFGVYDLTDPAQGAVRVPEVHDVTWIRKSGANVSETSAAIDGCKALTR